MFVHLDNLCKWTGFMNFEAYKYSRPKQARQNKDKQRL